MNTNLLWLGLLALGCSEPPPAPGPVPLEDVEQVRAFLTSGRLVAVGDSDIWCTFRADGTFEASDEGRPVEGRWRTTKSELTLMPTGAETERLPLRWLDGKLNIEIDGRPFRYVGD